MRANSIPLVGDIPFDVSPALRSLLSEVLDRLAALEERDRERGEEIALLREENRQKDDEITALRDEIALERAYDRRRIARLGRPRHRPSARRPPALIWISSSRR